MPKTARKTQKLAATSKTAKIIGLLQRNNGATIAELVKVTGWQAHSVRGFLSGTLKKKQGALIRSSREEGKPRRYVIDIAGDEW